MNTNAVGMLIVIAGFISGCASIVSGSSQQLSFNSETDEATVTGSGKVLGNTPLTVSVSRDKNQSITFEKEGYKTYTAQLSTTLNGWFWGNIVIGGLPGSTTDSVSGAMHQYSPDQYFVTLTPNQPLGIESNAPRSVKQLLIGSGPKIRLEIASGSGAHLDDLLKLLNITDENRSQGIAALKNLSERYKDDLEFAKKIIEVYEIK